MPTTGNNQNDNYSESLEQISELLEKYSSHSIILIGDMNASLHRDDRQRDKNYPIKTTFFHHNRRYSSQIDYVLCDPEMLELSPDVEIHDMSPLNTSDHVLTVIFCFTIIFPISLQTFKGFLGLLQRFIYQTIPNASTGWF
jgi:exonuclease III